MCVKAYPSKHNLALHKRKHDPNNTLPVKKHYCEICGKLFLQQGSLALHMWTHTGEHFFMCNVCDKALSSQASLMVHVWIHTRKKADVCGKAFISHEYLKVHQCTHTGEKPHTCDHCGKSFTHRSTLTVYKCYHTGQKPYQCEECNKCFVSKTLLQAHQKSHDRGQNFFLWTKNSKQHWRNLCGWIIITGFVYDNSATYFVHFDSFVLMYDIRYVIKKLIRVMLVLC